MQSATTDVLLRMFAWTFLPDVVSRYALNFLHRGMLARGYHVPQPGTPAFVQHYRRMFATVVSVYLAYNIVQATISTPSNFYQILGVPIDADENEMKAAFRSFARRNHPDRVGPAGAQLFIVVRDAYEKLRDPVARFAYDRFGPDAFVWDKCSTPRECVYRGIISSCGFYIASTFFMCVMWAFGPAESGSYWRHLMFAAMALAELCVVLLPDGSGLLGSLFPSRVPFQHALYLHQLFLALSVALSRVVPVLHPGDPTSAELAPLADQVAAMAMATADATAQVMSVELSVLSGDHLREELADEMEELVIERSLRSHPFVRAAWDSALAHRRKRAELPTPPGSTPRLPSPPESPVAPPSVLPLPTPMKRLVEEAGDGGDYVTAPKARARSRLVESHLPEAEPEPEPWPQLPPLPALSVPPAGPSLRTRSMSW